MTHFGSGIWSYTLRKAGAILLTSVPATIITSDCRGDGRNTTPKRSRSRRDAPACIISTAQQASPNVIGHIEPVRAQLSNASEVVVTKPRSISGLSPSGRRMSSTRPSGSGLFIRPSTVCSTLMESLPFQRSLLPDIGEADHQQRQEHSHLDQP